jgi:hypothetical protein
MARQLAKMERELAQVRASNLTLQDRLDALEQRREKTARDTANNEEGDGRPALEVVRLEPESAAPAQSVDDPGDDEKRPTIRSGWRGSVEMSEGAKPVLPQKR